MALFTQFFSGTNLSCKNRIIGVYIIGSPTFSSGRGKLNMPSLRYKHTKTNFTPLNVTKRNNI